MRRSLLAAAFVVAFAAPGAMPGCAQTQAAGAMQPLDVIAVRQSGMDMLYGSWRALTAGVTAKTEPKNFTLAVRGIITFGKLVPHLFPQSAGLGETGLAEIFEDRAGFEKAAANMVATAEALLKVTQANDAAGMPAAVKALSEACGACHPRKFARNWNEIR